MLYNALSMGKKTLKIAPSPQDSPVGERPNHGHKQHAQKMLKIARAKFYPQILSTEDSFYIYDRPLTEIHVIASFW